MSKWLYKHTAVSSVSSGTSRSSAVLAGECGGAMLPVGTEVMMGLSLSRLASWMTPLCSGSSALSSSVICERWRRGWGVRGWVPPGLSSKCRRSARVIQPASFRKEKLCEHPSSNCIDCIVSQGHDVRYHRYAQIGISYWSWNWPPCHRVEK